MPGAFRVVDTSVKPARSVRDYHRLGSHSSQSHAQSHSGEQGAGVCVCGGGKEAEENLRKSRQIICSARLACYSAQPARSVRP
jgi:hypothetical protein